MQNDENFASTIRKQGYRVTIQRQLILDAIRDGNGHSSPEEIYQRVTAKAAGINNATIYRNLNFLCGMRLVVSAQIGGHLYYELAGSEPHHHLICRKCDRVEQVGNEIVRAFFDNIELACSFLVDMEHLTLFGLCSDCRKSEDCKQNS